MREEAMQDWEPSTEGGWIFGARSGYLACQPQIAPNGYTVQSNGMQERLAASPGGAASLRAAFHAIHRRKLRGDEARDGARERSARAAARNHEIHHGERGAAGACGDERAAPDR